MFEVINLFVILVMFMSVVSKLYCRLESVDVWKEMRKTQLRYRSFGRNRSRHLLEGPSYLR